MSNNRRANISLLYSSILIIVFFAVVNFASRPIKHIGYQLFPVCWFCKDESWPMDETHTLSYSLPKGWNASLSESGRGLVIQSDEHLNSDITIFIRQLESDNELENSDLATQLDEHLPTLFANFQSFEIIEAAKAVEVGSYNAARAKLSTESYIRFDISSSQLFELSTSQAADFEGLKYMQEYEVYLIDYDGLLVQIGALWRLGTPEVNAWGYDQMRMILGSMEFE